MTVQAVHFSVGFKVRCQIPVVPTVVPAKRDPIAPSSRPSNAHRHGHGFTASPRVTDLLGPRVKFDQQLRQFDLFGIVQRTHRAGLHAADHRRGHFRIVVSQQARPDSHRGHVHVPPAIKVNDFTPLRFTVVCRPLLRCVHLRPLA